MNIIDLRLSTMIARQPDFTNVVGAIYELIGPADGQLGRSYLLAQQQACTVPSARHPESCDSYTS